MGFFVVFKGFRIKGNRFGKVALYQTELFPHVARRLSFRALVFYCWMPPQLLLNYMPSY